MYALPMLRLELEQMRYQVVHALVTHNREMEKLVEEEVTKVIDEMDWRGEIARIAEQETRQAVKDSVVRFFKYGDGRKMVDEFVRASLVPELPEDPDDI